GAVAKSNTIIIFINQLREKVGVVYGNPEVTTGGRALKFYSTMRIEVRRSEALKGAGSEIIGNRTRAKIVKNKVAPPFKEAEFDILYGRGISRDGEIVDLGVKFGILQKSGAWFSYGDMRLAQGRDNTREMLMNDPALFKEINDKVVYALNEAASASKIKKPRPTMPEPPAPQPTTKASARAKLDIVVDDDD
ncbi:MAG: DNA recombination/repair protein RecA, partial [Clostridia bacterium]|nr:DNA recombination/repair protein RecA [Clostridia bacterium]